MILFTSCSLLLGIKEPKDESIKALNSYLSKHNIDTSSCYAFTKNSFDSIQKLPYKPNWPVGFRPIQFKAFNHRQILVSQYSSCQGSWKKKKIFSSFPPKNIGFTDSTMTLSEDIKMYRNYYGSELKLNPNFDLTIIVYWVSSLGIINRNLVKAVYKYQKEHPDKKINIIKVNVAEFYSKN